MELSESSIGAATVPQAWTGVCDGKVYHRIEALLHVRDGRPRQDDYRKGNRPKHGADRHDAISDDVGASSEIASWMRPELTGPWYAACGSGCTGFHLCRELRRLGVDCDVVAASSIARSDADKNRKNDRSDASRLLSELLSIDPTYSVVWTPDEEAESARDLVRARFDAMAALKRSKNQASSILLRHGHVWNEKTARGNLKATWTRECIAWARSIDLGQRHAKDALDFCVRTGEEDHERVRELDRKLIVMSELPRRKPYVDAISLIKGVDWLAALLVSTEMGDFRRFRSGRDVSNWLGTVSRESSSAENTKKGRITKAGNAHCRTILVEGMAGASMRNASMKKLRTGQSVSPEVQAVCCRATKRLNDRFAYLTKERRMRPNKAKVAVANEAIRWIWAIGCMVQDEVSA